MHFCPYLEHYTFIYFSIYLIYIFSDELPVQLTLPRALREAKNRQQLSSLALLGQEFWRYPMANPKQIPNLNGDIINQAKTNLPNQQCTPTPLSQTPSDTGSSFGSFSINGGV